MPEAAIHAAPMVREGPPPASKPIAEIPRPAEQSEHQPSNIAWKMAIRMFRAGKAFTDSGGYIGAKVSSGKGLEDAIRAKQLQAIQAAVADVNVHEADSQYNKTTGEYVVRPDPAEPTKTETRNWQDAIPGIISGLEETAAQAGRLPQTAEGTTLSKNDQKNQYLVKYLSAETQAALNEFKQHVEVEITSITPVIGADGQPVFGPDNQPEIRTITEKLSYEKYAERVVQEAQRASGLTPEQWSGLSADDRDAYVFQARQKLGGKYSIRFEQPKAPAGADATRQDGAATTETPIAPEQMEAHTIGKAYDAIDAMLDPYGQAIPRDIKRKIDLSELERRDPTGELTSLAGLLDKYQRIDPKDTIHRGNAAALIHAQLVELKNGSATHEIVKQKLAGLDVTTTHYDERIGDMSSTLLRLAGVAENQIDRVNLSPAHLLRIALTARVCDGKMNFDQNLREFLFPDGIREGVNTLLATGGLNNTDVTLIKNLANNPGGSEAYLAHIFGIATGTVNRNTNQIATSVVSGIASRRGQQGSQFSPNAKRNYERVLQVSLDAKKQQVEKHSRVKMWSRLGIVGLIIMFPQLQALMQQTGDEDTGRGQPR